jgi:hypothetical protein
VKYDVERSSSDGGRLKLMPTCSGKGYTTLVAGRESLGEEVDKTICSECVGHRQIETAKQEAWAADNHEAT